MNTEDELFKKLVRPSIKELMKLINLEFSDYSDKFSVHGKEFIEKNKWTVDEYIRAQNEYISICF